MVFRLAFVFALLLVASQGLAEPAEDIENAATPITLKELLPPGGLEEVSAEFWMRIEASYDGRPMDTRFIHWHIRGIEGQLVCTLDSGTKENKLHTSATMTYDQDGRLKAYHNIAHHRGRKASDVVGEVIDGSLVLKTTEYVAADFSTTRSETRSLAAFADTVPSDWFTIIAAYHMREGNLGYSFSRTDTAYRFQHAETTIEDIGTEEVEWAGKTYTARMLLGERSFGKQQRDEPQSRLQYLLLPNGEMMYMRNLYYGYKFLGYRVTKEQIAEEFWLPPEEKAQPADQEKAAE